MHNIILERRIDVKSKKIRWIHFIETRIDYRQMQLRSDNVLLENLFYKFRTWDLSGGMIEGNNVNALGVCIVDMLI